jgi:hypothetical protein
MTTYVPNDIPVRSIVRPTEVLHISVLGVVVANRGTGSRLVYFPDFDGHVGEIFRYSPTHLGPHLYWVDCTAMEVVKRGSIYPRSSDIIRFTCDGVPADTYAVVERRFLGNLFRVEPVDAHDVGLPDTSEDTFNRRDAYVAAVGENTTAEQLDALLHGYRKSQEQPEENDMTQAVDELTLTDAQQDHLTLARRFASAPGLYAHTSDVGVYLSDEQCQEAFWYLFDYLAKVPGNTLHQNLREVTSDLSILEDTDGSCEVRSMGADDYTTVLDSEMIPLTEALLSRLGITRKDQADPEVDPNYLTECPEGYMTILEYRVRQGQDIDQHLFLRDGTWLYRRSSPYVKVKAPQVLKDMGIDWVNAYRMEDLAKLVERDEKELQAA